MRIIYAFALIVVTSCGTVRKIKSTTVTQQEHIDTSYKTHEYERETIITEKSTATGVSREDNISSIGSFSSSDTTSYTQESETAGMRIETTIKPKVRNGKVDGYDVKSQATAKPHTVDIPVDRKTTVKEVGKDKEQRGISDKVTTKIVTKDKETKGWSIWYTLSIVFVLIIIALIKFYKIIRK